MTQEASGKSLDHILRRAALEKSGSLFSRRAEDADGEGPLRPAAALDRTADRLARILLSCAPPHAQRAAILAAPEPDVIAAIAGAERAGLVAHLIPPGSRAQEIAAECRRVRAEVLMGPAEFGPIDMEGRIRDAAEDIESLGLIAVWKGAARDDLRTFAASTARRAAPSAPPRPQDPPPPGEPPLAPSACHGALTAAASAFIDQLRLTGGELVVSLVTVASPAGYLTGVLAPLVSGANMIWQAPFSARKLAGLLAAAGPAHLVAPASVAPALGAAGLLSVDGVASLTLIDPRRETAPDLAHDLDPARIFSLSPGPGATQLIAPWAPPTERRAGERKMG